MHWQHVYLWFECKRFHLGFILRYFKNTLIPILHQCTGVYTGVYSLNCSVENTKRMEWKFLTFVINLYLSASRESYNYGTFEENFHSILFLLIMYTGVKWVLHLSQNSAFSCIFNYIILHVLLNNSIYCWTIFCKCVSILAIIFGIVNAVAKLRQLHWESESPSSLQMPFLTMI